MIPLDCYFCWSHFDDVATLKTSDVRVSTRAFPLEEQEGVHLEVLLVERLSSCFQNLLRRYCCCLLNWNRRSVPSLRRCVHSCQRKRNVETVVDRDQREGVIHLRVWIRSRLSFQKVQYCPVRCCFWMAVFLSVLVESIPKKTSIVHCCVRPQVAENLHHSVVDVLLRVQQKNGCWRKFVLKNRFHHQFRRFRSLED